MTTKDVIFQLCSNVFRYGIILFWIWIYFYLRGGRSIEPVALAVGLGGLATLWFLFKIARLFAIAYYSDIQRLRELSVELDSGILSRQLTAVFVLQSVIGDRVGIREWWKNSSLFVQLWVRWIHIHIDDLIWDRNLRTYIDRRLLDRNQPLGDVELDSK